jgi:NitT/TauT family transport system substrate-binding protein
MRRIIATVAGLNALVLVNGLPYPPPAAAAEETAIRAAYTPATPWLLAWVAKEKGYFEKRGLNVSLSAVQNLSLLPGLLGSQYDFAPSTPPDLIKSVAAGLDVVAVCGGILEESSNHVTELIVRSDSGIKTVEDLEHKTIGAPTIGAVNHIATLYWLQQNGVDLKTVRGVEIPFPSMADQLKAKNVDAVEPVTPFAGAMLAAGQVSLGDPLLAVADPARGNLWIAQGRWARANRAIVGKWVDAQQEARAFVEASPAEARGIIAKYTGMPDPIVQRLPLPHFEPALTTKQIEPWIMALRALGQVSGPVDSTSLVLISD